MAALLSKLEGMQFNSLEAAQAWIATQMPQANDQALDDFHGLSSAQMHHILYSPFTSPETVRFAEVLDNEPEAPVVQLFSLLAAAIGDKGLKPTVSGNLPRNLCREIALTYRGDIEYPAHLRLDSINRELDFFELHVTRVLGQISGLIRKHKGRFILSRECRKLLAEGGMAAVYPRLLRAHAQDLNWAWEDRLPELRFVQTAFGFTLYLLSIHGDQWKPQEFYADAFLQAFPMLLEEVPAGYFGPPEDTLRLCYTMRTLFRFARFMGLASLERLTDDDLSNYRVKALPLLRRAVEFPLLPDPRQA